MKRGVSFSLKFVGLVISELVIVGLVNLSLVTFGLVIVGLVNATHKIMICLKNIIKL
jgi:hypothetical protein